MAFRFKTLLKLRKNKEDLMQRDFARANRHLLAQLDRLRFMTDIEGGSKREIVARMAEPVSSATLALYDNFFAGLRIQEKLQERVIEEVAVQVRARREALAEAMRKRKTLEILRERDWRAAEAEAAKREIALLDEAASIQWFRK
jgi:flagellar export protein FliJ